MNAPEPDAHETARHCSAAAFEMFVRSFHWTRPRDVETVTLALSAADHWPLGQVRDTIALLIAHREADRRRVVERFDEMFAASLEAEALSPSDLAAWRAERDAQASADGAADQSPDDDAPTGEAQTPKTAAETEVEAPQTEERAARRNWSEPGIWALTVTAVIGFLALVTRVLCSSADACLISGGWFDEFTDPFRFEDLAAAAGPLGAFAVILSLWLIFRFGQQWPWLRSLGVTTLMLGLAAIAAHLWLAAQDDIPWREEARRLLPPTIAFIVAGLLAERVQHVWLRATRPRPSASARDAAVADENQPRAIGALWFDGREIGKDAARPPKRLMDEAARSLTYYVSDEPSRELDIDASIEMTARTGAMTAVMKRRKKVAELLVIVDRGAAASADTALATAVCEEMAARGALASRLDYYTEVSTAHMAPGSLSGGLDADVRGHAAFAAATRALQNGSAVATLWTNARIVRDVLSPGARGALQRLLETGRAGFVDLSAERAGLGSLSRRAQAAGAASPTADGFLSALDAATGRATPKAPTAAAAEGADLARRVANQLGDAAIWASACAMVQPITPGLAEGLRRALFPGVAGDGFARMRALEGAAEQSSGLSFSRPVLALLRRRFIDKLDDQTQTRALRVIEAALRQAEPENKDGAEHLIWRWRLARFRLETDAVDEALEELVALQRTELADTVAFDLAETRFDGLPADSVMRDDPIPIRGRPRNAAALAELSEAIRQRAASRGWRITFRQPQADGSIASVRGRPIAAALPVEIGQSRPVFVLSGDGALHYWPNRTQEALSRPAKLFDAAPGPLRAGELVVATGENGERLVAALCDAADGRRCAIAAVSTGGLVRIDRIAPRDLREGETPFASTLGANLVLASAGPGDPLRLFPAGAETPTRERLIRRSGDALRAIAGERTGRFLALASADGAVSVYGSGALERGELAAEGLIWSRELGEISALAISPGGLCAAADPSGVSIFEPAQGRLRARLPIEAARSLAFAVDDVSEQTRPEDVLIARRSTGAVEAWSLRAGLNLLNAEPLGRARAIAISGSFLNLLSYAETEDAGPARSSAVTLHALRRAG